MKENYCNDWLTLRDKRYTLAYESLRRVTTTNECTRITTHLNFVSRFEYLTMFSSSSFPLKQRSRLHFKFISCSLVKMEDTQRVMLQYGAAMAHQEVFQQRIIINQLIRARLRGEEEHPEMAKAAPRETRQFGIYDQLKIEFIKEDPRTFLKSN